MAANSSTGTKFLAHIPIDRPMLGARLGPRRAESTATPGHVMVRDAIEHNVTDNASSVMETPVRYTFVRTTRLIRKLMMPCGEELKAKYDLLTIKTHISYRPKNDRLTDQFLALLSYSAACMIKSFLASSHQPVSHT
jgi:hypothetical protein